MSRRWQSLSLLVFAAASCGRASAVPESTHQRPAPPVYVAPAETRTVYDRVRTVGQLEADEQVELKSEIKGTIAAVLVEDGQQVEAGQVLFRLNDARQQAGLAEGQARVREIEANLVKVNDDLAQDRRLHEQGIIDVQQVRATQSRYDALQASLSAATARVTVLEVDLRDTVIRAPITGVVTERQVYTGDYVEDGDGLVDILRIDPLELRFSVNERQLAGVDVGDRVDFLVTGFDDEVFHGELYYIAPEADMASRNVAVKAHVPNGDRRLRPGFFVRLQVISAERPDTVVIPENAVVLDGGTATAYVLAGETAELRILELGRRTDDNYFEVRSGIAAGEPVLVRGQVGLPDGANVTVIER